MDLEAAKICDAVLDKFRGDKSYTWDEMHQEDFYKSISDSYYVVENAVKFLLSNEENSLEDRLFGDITYFGRRICLSPKGFAILGGIHKNYTDTLIERYEDKQIAKDAVKYSKYAFGIGVVGVLIAVLIELLHHVPVKQGNQHSANDTPVVKPFPHLVPKK